MKSVVSKRGRVTIPKPLRDRLGLRAGTVLDFDVQDGRLVAVKREVDDPVGVVFGILTIAESTDAAVERLRGKPDAESHGTVAGTR